MYFFYGLSFLSFLLFDSQHSVSLRLLSILEFYLLLSLSFLYSIFFLIICTTYRISPTSMGIFDCLYFISKIYLISPYIYLIYILYFISNQYLVETKEKNFWAQRDSNPGPAVYMPSVLTIRPQWLIENPVVKVYLILDM